MSQVPTAASGPGRGWPTWLVGVAGIGLLLWLLAPVLTPFAVSLLLAWLGVPLVDRIQRRGLARTWAVSLVFLLMSLFVLLALLVLLPLVEHQINRLFGNLPRYLDWIQHTALPWLAARTGLSLAAGDDGASWPELLHAYGQQAGGVAKGLLGSISRSGLALLGWLASATLVPVLTFYFLRDWPHMLDHVRELLPRPLEPTVSRLARDADTVLAAFLRGQVSVMAVLSLIYALGLALIGIDLAVLIGLGAGLLSFVPYLGAFLGVSGGVLAAWVQFGDWTHVLWVLAVFGIGQALESFVLTPWLVGDRIGLHPVAVIFALMVGGELFGFLGLLLALPVAAVAMVLIRFAHARYLNSALYGLPPVSAPAAVEEPADTSTDVPTP